MKRVLIEGSELKLSG